MDGKVDTCLPTLNQTKGQTSVLSVTIVNLMERVGLIKVAENFYLTFVGLNQTSSFEERNMLLSHFNNTTSQKKAFMFGGNLSPTKVKTHSHQA